ncbi:hypothetical protein U1Q18_001100, partial [Sarracenia purpurea var. burkii]
RSGGAFGSIVNQVDVAYVHILARNAAAAIKLHCNLARRSSLNIVEVTRTVVLVNEDRSINVVHDYILIIYVGDWLSRRSRRPSLNPEAGRCVADGAVLHVDAGDGLFKRELSEASHADAMAGSTGDAVVAGHYERVSDVNPVRTADVDAVGVDAVSGRVDVEVGEGEVIGSQNGDMPVLAVLAGYAGDQRVVDEVKPQALLPRASKHICFC